MRSLLRHGAAWLLILLALLAGGEFGARAWMHHRYAVPGHHYGRWEADAQVGARMASNRYNHRFCTNDGGFRNDENLIEPRPPGALRIICYGGSTTLCWNLRTPETWPSRLEAILRERRRQPSDQVLNAGDILWSIGHVAARAREEVPRLRPDVVVVASGLNEEGNARMLAASGRSLEREVRSGRYGAFARNLPQNAWLARNSVVFAAGQRFITRPLAQKLRHLRRDRWAGILDTPVDAAHPPQAPEPWIVENYTRTLGDLIAFLQERGVRVVYVVEARGRDTVGLRLLTDVSRAGEAVARERGAVVVDAQQVVESWPGDPMELFRESGIHWSAAGAAKLAEAIWEAGFAAGPAPRP